MTMNIKSELKKLKFDISALLFDWGNTIMPIFPDQFGPMARWERLELIHGAEQILPLLKEKYLLAVLSNADDSDRQLVTKALSIVGAAKHFSHIFTPQELFARKPAPQFFHNALLEMNVDPEHAVMVGDDYEKDIIGAKQAGLWTIWFNQNGKEATAKYPYHDFEINSLLQIPEILRRKFK